MNQVQPLSIAGIYEVCMGVADAIPQLQYYEQFGYRLGQIGELSASEACELYELVQECDRFDSITKMRIAD